MLNRKKNKGVVLITVLIVFAVLSILGAAILDRGVFEAKIVSMEDKKLQAQYLARSGAQAALSAWKTALKAGSTPPAGTDTIYLDNSNDFVHTPPASYKGKFDVTVQPPTVAGGVNTVITSVGTVGDVTQKTQVTIIPFTYNNTIQPLPTVNAEDYGWVSFNSGQISTGTHIPGPSGKAVKVSTKGGKGLKLPNQNTADAKFQAEQILITSPINVIHNNIELKANLIAFTSTIDLSKNTAQGKITLKILIGKAINTIPGYTTYSGVWGIVYFQSAGYYYKDGTVLGSSTTSTQVLEISKNVTNGNLVPITSGPDKNNPFTSTTVELISSYKEIWN